MKPAAFPSLILTAAFGLLGAWVAQALGLPAPFLLGPAALVTMGSLSGLRFAVPIAIRNVAFLAVGLSMGASVTPQVIAAAWAWPLSFLMLIAMSAFLLFLVFFMLRRSFGYDAMTAMLASCPGHLSYVLSLAAGVKSDLVSVGVVQSVRVLALTLLVPLFVELSDPAPAMSAIAIKSMSAVVVFAMALPALGIGLVLQKWGVPAALLVGGMLVSSSLHVTGIVEGTIPVWVQLPVYVVLGSMIGARFSGVSFADLRKAAFAGTAVTLVAGVVSILVSLAVSAWLDIPLPAALIAFAPGGLETMAAMAVILNADPAYVATHHIVRLVFLSFLMPAMIAWVRDR